MSVSVSVSVVAFWCPLVSVGISVCLGGSVAAFVREILCLLLCPWVSKALKVLLDVLVRIYVRSCPCVLLCIRWCPLMRIGVRGWLSVLKCQNMSFRVRRFVSISKNAAGCPWALLSVGVLVSRGVRVCFSMFVGHRKSVWVFMGTSICP